MGHSILSFPRLLPPLVSLTERYATIPAGQVLSFNSDVFKIVYFLGSSLQVELADGSWKDLHEGDAISTDRVGTLRYRPLHRGQEARNHVLVLRLSKKTARAKNGMGPAQFAGLLRKQLGGFHHFPEALRRGDGREILHLIRKEADKGAMRSLWKISSLCLALAADLAGVEEPAAAGEAEALERGEAAVEHAKHYILEHCHENLTLTKIAWQVQLSGGHLEKLFKQYAGITVFDHLDQVRTEKAKQLLLTTELPMVRVATLCGYSSSTLLGRHFKARVGMTPVAYRLRARQHERFTPSHLQIV